MLITDSPVALPILNNTLLYHLIRHRTELLVGFLEKKEKERIRLGTLVYQHRCWVIGTWILVVAEAVLLLMFPLFIGMAVDDLLSEKFQGLVALGGFGFATVTVGSARRFYDTRVYSKIYACVSKAIVAQEHNRNSDISTISARTNMATELVDFMENLFPEIIQSLIGLGGALILIYFLQVNSFVACLIATLVIVAIYLGTSRLTFRLNQGANDEFEKRVEVIKRNTPAEISKHFRKVIRWNIRLSDLETWTFSASWIVLIAVLLYSIWATVIDGVTTHGNVLAILMYVFNYIESVIVLPLFYQQAVRVNEIATRLNAR